MKTRHELVAAHGASESLVHSFETASTPAGRGYFVTGGVYKVTDAAASHMGQSVLSLRAGDHLLCVEADHGESLHRFVQVQKDTKGYLVMPGTAFLGYASARLEKVAQVPVETTVQSRFALDRPTPDPGPLRRRVSRP